MKRLSEHVILLYSQVSTNLWGYVYAALNSIDDNPHVCLNNVLHH